MRIFARAFLLGLLALSFCPSAVLGQNLVVNPSFELYTYCRDTTSVVQYTAVGLTNLLQPLPVPTGTGATGWFSCTATTPLHVLPCNTYPSIRLLYTRYTGWFRPHTGSGYIILDTYDLDIKGRNYAQGQLLAPLRTGCTYRVSCWVRVARSNEGSSSPPPAPVASDNLAAYFSTARFCTTTTAPLIGPQPQARLLAPGQLVTDTLNYVLLSRTFVAQGGEQYFTLGNFDPDAATTVRRMRPSPYPLRASYAIDDVSVEAVPPPGLTLELGPDQWLGTCTGSGPATLTAPAGFQGYHWSTGQNTASIQISQPGRYVVTADYGCGTLRDSVEVRRYAPGLVSLLPTLPALCPGQTLTLTAASGFRDYQWADGFSGAARPVSQPGRFRLLARTADGCTVRDSVEVVALPPPLIPAGLPADTLVCSQDALRLTLPAPPPGVSYAWSTGSTGPTLYVAPGTSGAYTLTASNRCQTTTATVRVRVQDCAPLLTIPNIVTPNGDQRNDRFRVTAPSSRTLHLQVFSRWGQLVFESTDYHDQWPASPQVAPGLYYYLLRDDTYGRRYRGWVEVVR